MGPHFCLVSLHKKMKTFIVFLGLFGAAVSLPERAIDRNIFNDAWNGVKDAWNTGVSGARFAGLLANCNGDLRSIVSDFDATFIDDFKLMKDKREVHPHFGQELGKMAKNLDDLSTCMKGSWFGRTYENTRSLKVAATSPAERLDVMGMLTDAFNMGKFRIDMVGKIFNCRGEITALVTDSKIDDILHDLQPLLALDVTEFDQQDINGFADNFKEASDDLKDLSSKSLTLELVSTINFKNQGKISRQE